MLLENNANNVWNKLKERERTESGPSRGETFFLWKESFPYRENVHLPFKRKSVVHLSRNYPRYSLSFPLVRASIFLSASCTQNYSQIFIRIHTEMRNTIFIKPQNCHTNSFRSQLHKAVLPPVFADFNTNCKHIQLLWILVLLFIITWNSYFARQRKHILYLFKFVTCTKKRSDCNIREGRPLSSHFSP